MAATPPLTLPRSRLSVPRVRGLARSRLGAILDGGRPSGLVLIEGAPGVGKTTAAAHWVVGLDAPVAWFRAARTDPAGPAAPTVLTHVAAALDHALGGVGPPGTAPVTVDDVALRLERASRPPVLVVDDVHLLDRPDQLLLEELALAASRDVCLVLVGRRRTSWNLARGELAAQVQLDDHDLRFRPWEVETLFRERYDIPLGSADAVELTRRTGGWAAGLSLLNGALRRLGPGAVVPALSGLTERARYASTYLDDQVFPGMSVADRAFLRRTSAFDVLTVARCNRLLDRDDAESVLRRLHDFPLVLEPDDADDTFRVHPAVRRHLAAELADDLGADAVHAWYRRAADVLAEDDVPLETLVARCRAQDWDGVRRLLDVDGPQLTATQTEGWVRMLPADLVAEHPWAGLAHAVALLEDGRFAPAVQAARTARGRFGDDVRGRRACDHVVRRASAWTSSDTTMPTRWEDVLRAATRRDPASAAQRAQLTDSPMRLVCEGVALILAGNHELAAVVLRRCALDPSSEVVAQLSARLLLAAVAAFGDRTGIPVTDLDGTHTEAEKHGLTWLARMARGVAIARGGQRHDLDIAAALVAECDAMGDRWGAALIALASALSELRAGECDIVGLERLVERFRALDAGVLEAWTRALYAVTAVHEGLPDAFRDARLAEALARAASVPGALALAYAALGAADAGGRADYTRLAEATGRAAGLGAKPWTWLKAARAHTHVPVEADPAPATAPALPPPTPSTPSTLTTVRPQIAARAPAPAAGTAPAVAITALGGFALDVDGRSVDLSRVRPRARAVLRLLCLHAGRPVHRELLAELFWPDLTVSAALHNLHVAVSSLRGTLEPDVARRASRLLVRDGQAYLLTLAPGSRSDLREFDLAVQAAARARLAGDDPAHRQALQQAMDLYVGDVLPEDGPAEWVVQVREEYRLRAAESAYGLAGVLLAAGDAPGAARAAGTAVRIDRWHDGAWRTLVEALEQTGDVAAAARARRSYADVLAGLGVQ